MRSLSGKQTTRSDSNQAARRNGAKLLKAMSCFAATIVLSSLFVNAAKAELRLREYELSSDLHLVYFAADAFSCRSPAAMRALQITSAEISIARNQIGDLQRQINAAEELGDPVGVEWFAPRSKDLTVLRGEILPRLMGIAQQIHALPPCFTPFHFDFVEIGGYRLDPTGMAGHSGGGSR